jgi:flagellar basal body-associated protein FliL
MSDDKTDSKARKGDAAAPPTKGVSVVVLILTAVVAAGAAGGASLYVSKRANHAPRVAPAAAAHAAPAPSAPPGFTLSLDPFVVMTIDAQHSFHAMRATIALEFAPTTREDDVRPYVARIRDATLSLLRAVTYEAASDPAQTDRLRSQLRARFQETGVQGIARVLITDLVVQ